ncbi:class I SAM-dependent methyltransferase [Streptomyces sp. N2-109]|uniref:Class I SAM-dependent methyltransferase n=1 Tax=Streptomyces gossypii TaxID=2883101 RepID=A0ABT2K0V9_9ACTN|nr:class I SAM-dependent methyltransferase [Streptomyces gossypii]MCT2593170.1 class I SAM-dependent methyltransferase [Streptomyces gossypii]
MSAPGSTPVEATAENLSERSERVGSLFDDVADHFNKIAEKMSAAPGLNDWINARLPGGGRALDAGCGTGRYCPLLADRYEQVLGIDVADALLDIGRAGHSRPNIRYEKRSAYDVTAARDGQFDAVFSYSAVFHMRPYDQILPHLRSLVAPGGLLMVFEPERTSLHDRRGKDADWLTDVAFQNAQTAYRITSDIEAATDALHLFLNPSWRELCEHSVLPSREEFHETFSAWLPGTEFFHDVVPAMGVALWRAPAD